MPFFLTILAKHQAFAPSSEMGFSAKLKFDKVEFALRPSAKAFESSSWIDQTLGPLSPPFLLENLSGCSTVGFCVKYGFFYLLTFVTSSLAEFDQKKALKRNRHPNKPQPIWPPHHHKTTSEESESPLICICPWNMLGQSIWEHTFKILKVTERQLWFSMWPKVSKWTEVRIYHLWGPIYSISFLQSPHLLLISFLISFCR